MHQQQVQFEEARREKADAKTSTVTKMFGKENFQQLLQMIQLPNEQHLVNACPIYQAMTNSSKTQQMGCFQNSINKELMRQQNLFLKVILSPALFNNFFSLQWNRTNEDSLTSGFLRNLFLFGDMDEEHQQLVNMQAGLVQSGDMAVSSTDTKEILKLKVNLPQENKSIMNLK